MQHQFAKFNVPARQNGVVLFVAIILLFILSLIGVTVARMQTVEERMAQNENNRQLGAQAAEAALRNAEAGLLTGVYQNFTQNTAGLYNLTAATGSVVPTLNWNTASLVMSYNAAPAGGAAGPALTGVPPNSQNPKYVIENLPPVAVPGQSLTQVQYAAPVPPITVFRVSAYGVGPDGTSATIVQSIVR